MIQPLHAGALIEAACKQTGLSDFGGETWRPALEILIDSANREARLNAMGRASLESHVVTLLVNRLQVADRIRRHPGILAQKIEAPLFIVGLGRTGSTRLQYLLAQDPATRSLRRFESVRSCPLGEPAGPGPDPRIALMEREDEAAGLLVPEFKSIHHEPVDGPTECVMLFRQEFRSFCLESQWALPAWGEWFMSCDMAPAYAYHHRVLQVLQAQQPGRWMLKSPVHSMALDALVAEYPDARFVMTHRDPLQVVASTCSLALTLVGLGSDADHGAYLIRRWTEVSRAVIDRILDFRARHPQLRFHDLHYRQLVADPVAAVRGIYEHFGERLEPLAEERIGTYAAAHRQGEFGAHRYSAAEFGLDQPSVRRGFADYCERFGVAMK
jgi:hypothetical protein